MLHMKPPAISEVSPAVLTTEQLTRLVKACDGPRFVDRRDMAVVRLFIDSGMRLSELANLRVQDVDLDDGIALVVGKGARPRACPFGGEDYQRDRPLPTDALRAPRDAAPGVVARRARRDDALGDPSGRAGPLGEGGTRQSEAARPSAQLRAQLAHTGRHRIGPYEDRGLALESDGLEVWPECGDRART